MIRFVPRAVVHGHTGAVNDCAFNSNGDSLASVGVDKNLLFWDVVAVLSNKSTTPNEKSLYSCHSDSISCCAWSDRKELLVNILLMSLFKLIKLDFSYSGHWFIRLHHKSLGDGHNGTFDNVHDPQRSNYRRYRESKTFARIFEI